MPETAASWVGRRGAGADDPPESGVLADAVTDLDAGDPRPAGPGQRHH